MMSIGKNTRSQKKRVTTRAWSTIFVLLTTALSGQAGMTANANPLCISADQRESVELELKKPAPQSLAKIAQSTGLTEAAVVHALPVGTRVPVALSELDSLWKKLTEWDDASLKVHLADGVFEMFGPLPQGTSDEAFFVVGGPGNNYMGRLAIDSLAASYLISAGGGALEIHEFAIFDRYGRRILSVRVPQNMTDSLQSQPHNMFLRLKEAYLEISRRQLLTDLSCMWESKSDQGRSNVNEQPPLNEGETAAH